MEVKTIDNKKELKIEISGTDETIVNLLISKLKGKKGVEFASYIRPHPLFDKIDILIRAKENPKKIVAEALKEVKEDLAKFRGFLPAKTKPKEAKKAKKTAAKGEAKAKVVKKKAKPKAKK